MDPHDTMPELALEWHLAGKSAALATVIETWGSAPRPVGSQLVIDGEGRMMGSVSGGCVEGAVVEEALAALADRQPRLLTYGVSDENAFAVGLACGGTIRILVEPVGGGGLPVAMLTRITKARAAREPLAYRIDLADWSRQIIEGLPSDNAPLAARFRADQSGLDDTLFFAIYNPPLRLLVVGAVHIAQALLPMANACGYDCTLIDPREAFGAAARFPGQTIRHDWPDAALHALAPDGRTAVVTLTHDSKLDDPAILAALATNVFYLGCLGSKRTHEKRLARLRDAGVTEAQIARIHAPVGLAIGARSPGEIALSILAQITQTLRTGR